MCKITVNVDDKKKENVQKILAELGISISVAIRLYLDAIQREGNIPEDVDPFYSKSNMDFLRKSKEQLENGDAEYHDIIRD